ncbi:MAG: MEDS domain-containing protein [Actinomycetota bacterium]
MTRSRTHVHRNEHVVQFYDSDDHLAESVRDYLLPALRGGEAVIVVATDVHRDSIEAMLVGAGINLSEAAVSSRYIARRAEDVRGEVMVDGNLDGAALERVFGGAIAAARGRGRSVRLFGEMVALLWGEGDVAATLEIEAFWNRFTTEHPLSVYCAYPMTSFDRALRAADRDRISGLHSRVIPVA